MFAQSIFVAAIAAIAVASPLAARTDSCSTGPIKCCNKMESHQSAKADMIASLLKLDLGGITGEFSMECSPIANLVGGGSKCSGQTVCCQDTKFNGLVNIGCTPINIGL